METAKELVSDALEKLWFIIEQENEKHLIEGSHEDLEKLSSSFPTIHAAIHEAEAKSLSLKLMDNGSDDWKGMQEALLKLKDLACDIEDLLDRQSFKALTAQKEHDGDPTALHLQSQLDEQSNIEWVGRFLDKVRNFLPPCLRLVGLKKFLIKREIRALRFTTAEIMSSHFTERWWTRTDIIKSQSYSGRHREMRILGRDADIKNIINLLLNDEDSQQALPVISIVGAGGLGKTALAQDVCDYFFEYPHFDSIIRVLVSDRDVVDFDVRRIAKLIVSNLTNSPSLDYISDPLQLLQESVGGMKFLLLLDDVWTLDIENWSQLKNSLQTASMESRIMLTTRREKVAMALSTSHPYYLQPLDNDACWLLFKSIAFWHRSEEQCLMLKDIGKEIVTRSAGMPLFVKAWGGILLLEDTREGWESISKCDIWAAARFGVCQHFPNFSLWKDVLQTLEPSYVHLPSHLKRCFKYCSLFPKGCWIYKEELIQLWMAEGFINLEDGRGEKMEEIGAEYFNDLLSETSFFKDIERDDDGKIVRCKMHEPLHDVICYISDEFSLIKDGRFKKLPSISRTQHSSLHCVKNALSISSSFFKANKMRTLLCFGKPGYLKVRGDFLSCLKFLRVLDLSLTNIEELSYSVGTLRHLRYLNLSYTRIKKLPAFICNLHFLQTLKLSYSLLHDLPKEMWKLQKLRHLEIDGAPMNHLPCGMEKLSKIRKLSEFIVGDESGCSIRELGNLNFLQGRLIISNLEGISDGKDTERANLNKKECLDYLILDGKRHFYFRKSDHKRHINSLLLEHMNKGTTESNLYSDSEMKRVESVFEGINPHVNLKWLEIWNYIGLKFPKWVEDVSLKNLISLKLVKCLKVKLLPHFGELPCLKCLHICEMLEVEHIGDIKGFPKLERLVFERMLGLKVWELRAEEGDMPCLVELKLDNCPSLSALPCLPMTLRNLEIYNCQAISLNHPLPPVEHLIMKGHNDMLPLLLNFPKLMSLKITSSPELTSFPSGLNQLKALRTLSIYFCPKLESLPQELQHLTTLKELHIVGCPLLTKWYEKEKSKDWVARKLVITIDNTYYIASKGFDSGDDDDNDEAFFPKKRF